MAAEVSIRRRLLGLLLVALIVTWGLATVVTWIDTHREIDRLLDAHLAHTSTVLAAQAGHELLELDTDDLLEMGEYGHEVTFQVWEGGERLAVKSADAPGVRLSDVQEGFSDTTLAGRPWRVFTTWDKSHSALIEVAEDHGVRDRIAAQVVANALLPLAVALPLLALLVWWGVGRALRPLADLGEQVRHRDPATLEPLGLEHVPGEAAPLIRRLNELFARIRRSAELERRFTADAAHELRKPVAALRAQAEVARSTHDTATRDHALDSVLHACDRMATLMEQLLMLARVEQESAMRVTGRLDLAAIASRAIAEVAPGALASDVEIALESTGKVTVHGQPDLLVTLVGNLLWNAVRHGRGPVRVTVTGTPSAVTLAVADAGPGVPADQRQRLGERFFRGETSGPGSGLGLSIVRRIAEIHRAEVAFLPGPAGRGFEVRVSFPALPPPASASEDTPQPRPG